MPAPPPDDDGIAVVVVVAVVLAADDAAAAATVTTLLDRRPLAVGPEAAIIAGDFLLVFFVDVLAVKSLVNYY